MQNKLLPCPFCNGEAGILKNGAGCYQVYCDNCETRQYAYAHKTKESAIKHWNTRKHMERIVEQLEEHKLIVEIDDDHIVPESDVDEFFELEVVALSSAIEIVRNGGKEYRWQ